MATVSVDDSSLQYRWTLSHRWLAESEGRQLIGTVLHSSCEPDELYHDDSTINIVWSISITVSTNIAWRREN